MSDKYGFSDIECKIILAQIERRAKLRKEFLRLRSDPCQNSLQAGYVVRITFGSIILYIHEITCKLSLLHDFNWNCDFFL